MQTPTEMAAQAEARRQAAAAIAEYDARRRARGIIIEAAAEGDNWAIGILTGADAFWIEPDPS